MAGVLAIINENRSEAFKCLPCERVNLDYGQFGEYQDSKEHPAEEPFEHPRLEHAKKRLHEVPRVPSILKYFLDGSRKTYKVADVILGGRSYLPVVAGQIGVGVMRRVEDGSRVEPFRDFCRFQNVIAFPDTISNEDLKTLESEINSRLRVKFLVLPYRVRKGAEGKDPVDLAVARIMSEMADIEIEAVKRMQDEYLLSENTGLLVIDGPLRFKKRFDPVQFRNVLGLSKTFRPTFTVGKGRGKVDVGSITSGLGFRERTSVFRTAHDDKTIGMWYLRMRSREHMANPLQGIVKIERYATDSAEHEEGFDAEQVDVTNRSRI